MVAKRFTEKLKLLENEVVPPVAYQVENAELIVIGFGSTYGAILEAVRQTQDPKIGFIHLPQVWPLPKTALSALIRTESRVVTAENNAGGQLAKLLWGEMGITSLDPILKFDGRPFDPDFLAVRLRGLRK